MAQDGEWVTFDNEEELSLSHLPVTVDDVERETHKKQDDLNPPKSAVTEDFEFLRWKAEDDNMCAADDVFSHGLILPLRPSISSDASWGASQSGSRSESMDRCSSAAASLVFTSSRSSSGRISRSYSSNNFYAHPSPTPQVRRRRRRRRRRSSASSSLHGWVLFRLGVVKAPEMDPYDRRSRRASGGRKSNHETEKEKKVVRDGENAKEGKRVMRFMGRGLSCGCSADVVGVVDPQEVSTARRKEEEGSRLKGRERVCYRSRMLEWLEEFSIYKASLIA